MKVIVAIDCSSLFLGISCVMALLGFVPLEALEGLSIQGVWHGASQRGDRDRVKLARRSRAIHYKINDQKLKRPSLSGVKQRLGT